MNRKGFLATSLIYSFFLVFLMLMAVILARGVSNRVLLNSLKEEIRSELDTDEAFVVDQLEVKNYSVGEVVSYAGDDWQVVQNKTSSIVLVLRRALNRAEIIKALGQDSGNTVFYGTCDASRCMVKACRDVPSFDPANPPVGIYGRENCYYDSRNPSQYIKPAWIPIENDSLNVHQVESLGYGQMVISTVINNWFRVSQGLQKALEKDKLVAQSFSDGFLTYPQTSYGQESLYVRIPNNSDLSTISSWNVSTLQPFHILTTRTGPTINANQVPVYNNGIQAQLSNVAAYIRPVIEVKKG